MKQLKEGIGLIEKQGKIKSFFLRNFKNV